MYFTLYILNFRQRIMGYTELFRSFRPRLQDVGATNFAVTKYKRINKLLDCITNKQY